MSIFDQYETIDPDWASIAEKGPRPAPPGRPSQALGAEIGYTRDVLVGNARAGHISIPGGQDINPELYAIASMHRADRTNKYTFPLSPGLIISSNYQEAVIAPLASITNRDNKAGTRRSTTLRMQLTDVPDGTMLFCAQANMFFIKRVADGKDIIDPVTKNVLRTKPKFWITKEDATEKNRRYAHYFEPVEGDKHDVKVCGVVSEQALTEHLNKYGQKEWSTVWEPSRGAANISALFPSETFSGAANLPEKIRQQIAEFRAGRTSDIIGIDSGTGLYVYGYGKNSAGEYSMQLAVDENGGIQRVESMNYRINQKGMMTVNSQSGTAAPIPMFNYKSQNMYANNNGVIETKKWLFCHGLPVDPSYALKPQPFKFATEDKKFISPHHKDFEKAFLRSMRWLYQPEVINGKEHQTTYLAAFNDWDIPTQKKKYEELKEHWKRIAGDPAYANLDLTKDVDKKIADNLMAQLMDIIEEKNPKIDAHGKPLPYEYWKAEENAKQRLPFYGILTDNATPLSVDRKGELTPLTRGKDIRTTHKPTGNMGWVHATGEVVATPLGNKIDGGGNRPAFHKFDAFYEINEKLFEYLEGSLPSSLKGFATLPFTTGHEKARRIGSFFYNKIAASPGDRDALPDLAVLTGIAHGWRETALGFEWLAKGSGILTGTFLATAAIATATIAAVGLPIIAAAAIAVLPAAYAGSSALGYYGNRRQNDLFEFEKRLDLDVFKLAKQPAEKKHYGTLGVLSESFNICRRGVREVLFSFFETKDNINSWKLASNITGAAGICALAIAGAGAAAALGVVALPALIPFMAASAVVGGGLVAAGVGGRMVTDAATKGQYHLLATGMYELGRTLPEDISFYSDQIFDQFDRGRGWNLARDMPELTATLKEYETIHDKSSRKLGLILPSGETHHYTVKKNASADAPPSAQPTVTSAQKEMSALGSTRNNAKSEAQLSLAG